MSFSRTIRDNHLSSTTDACYDLGMKVLALLALVLVPARLQAMTIIVPSIDLSPEAQAPGTGGACLAAASASERDRALPPDLLGAIGRVESGRWDAATHGVVPWPWTVNAAGSGHMFASAQQAVAYVTSLQAQGVRSIDVGCFQVNLRYHPAAFASLDQAFDPAANAAYAADFLDQLHRRSGSWEQAVGDYHSHVPEQGDPYRRRVLLSLARSDSHLADTARSERRPTSPPALRDPVTILSSPVARAVNVVEPEDALTARMMPQSHMPRVYVP